MRQADRFAALGRAWETCVSRVTLRGTFITSLLVVATLAWLAAGTTVPARLHAAAAQQVDTDGDTMPDAWETFFGLDPSDPSDASGDPDGDGLTNAQEFAAQRHPNGQFTRYFAEGSTGYFNTSVGVVNLSTTDTAHVAIALLDEGAGVVSHQLTLAPRQRQTVSINDVLGIPAAVAIIVESDVPVAADRFMTWGSSGIGASLDSGAPAPATTWYFAEGATGAFLLYYLFENPGTTPANVSIRYLVEGGPPVTTTHVLPPQSRTTIGVNQEDPALAASSVGSVITSDVPIFAERAMYVNAGGTLGGGSASAGSNLLSTQWYFGEGSTGPFFHCFLSLLNPGATAATATVTYHLQDGSTATKAYLVPAEGRRTVYFNGEAASDPALAGLATGPVWFTVSATQPILGERAMWWWNWPWYEGHAAPGNTTSADSWAVPEGRHGGPGLDETYVLVGNTTTTPGQVRLTLIPDTGAPQTRDVGIAAGERLTLNVGVLFGLTEGRFSVIVDSLGTPATPLAVDYARYRSVNGVPFSGGGAAPAIPVPAGDAAPTVTATTPAANATGVAIDANLSVTFSEPVNAGAGAFVLECPAATPIALVNLTASPATTFTLDPTPNLPLNTVCRLRIVAAEITDVDTTDPPDTMAANVDVPFTTAACATITVSPTVVPGGTINVAYAPVQFTQTGGTLPITWTLTAGALPSGMTLSAAGQLAGTPTVSGPFSFTVTATDANACTGSAPLSLTVLTGPNVAPSFTPGGNPTVLEDAGPQSVAWATAISPGPPAESGQALTFLLTGNTNPGLFSVAPAISPTGTLTYTVAPNANGAATITVALQDNGGTANGGADTSASVPLTITVTAVNDAPGFTVGANQTVLEDAGAQAVPGWGTVISTGPADEAAQTLAFSVASNSNPTLFSAGPAVSAAGDLTYTPAPNANGTATITLTLTDTGGTANGGVDAFTAPGFTITVTAVNDPPLAVADAATTDEDNVLTVPVPGVLSNDTDPDLPGDLLVVSQVNGVPANVGTPFTLASGATLTLNADGSGVYDPTAVAAFQALPQGQTATDSFTYTMQDGGGLASSATVTITIPGVNDVPVLDLDADGSSGATGANYQLTFTEGDSATFIQDATDATITDVDSPTLSAITVTLTNLLDPTFEVLAVDLAGFPNFAQAYDTTSDPTQGVLTITTVAPQPIADFVTVLRRVTYRNTDTAPDATSRAITVVVDDGAGFSNTATSTVTIVPVDSPATAVADSFTVAEGATLTTPAPGVLGNDSDPDNPGATLTAAVVTSPANSTSFTLNADGSFSYQHNGGETTTDSFTYTATSSAGGGPSTAATVTITITPVNDAPVIATPGTINTFTEDGPAAIVDNAVTITDADNANMASATVTLLSTPDGVAEGLGATSCAGLTIGGAGTATLTITGSQPIATYLTCLRSVTYANTSQDPNPAARTVRFVVNDGSAASNGADKTMNVLPANDAPVVANETLDVLGNTELRVDMVAGTTPNTTETTSNPNTVEGVLDNDTDPEGNPFAVTAITGCADAIAPFDCTLADGAVIHVEANGEFSYTPGPGDTVGSFTYTVTDTPAVGTAASSTGTVTFAILDMIWYVDADAPAGGNGTSRLPFNTFTAATLSGANGAGDLDDADDYIFVHSATAAISAGIELEAGQHLIGEPVGLSIPRNLNGNGSPTVLVPANAALSPPVINGGAGNSVTVTEALPAEIVGLTLGSLNAIDVTTDAALTGATSLTIADNVINGATAEGIDVNVNVGTTGTLTLAITGNSWNLAGTHTGNAVDINRAAGTLHLNFSNNTNLVSANAAGAALVINGGAAANTIITGFANNTISGNTAGAGVSIANATFDANAAAGGIQQVAGGILTVGAGGNPVGAAGMVLSPVVGNLSFSDLDVLGGTSGVTLNGSGGSLTLAVTPGVSTISALNGPAFDVTTAAVNIQLGSLTSTTSTAGLSLTNVIGTFSAPAGSTISKTSGAGTAFSVTSSALTLTYAGSLNVTAGAGVSLTSNTGSTITFSGGMTLNTGINAAFSATGGGTVNVCDENPCNPAATGALVNTLTTTTATALNVANTTIGASKLEFRSISANGAASGIVLNNTGAIGGLTIAGNGGACTSAATCTGGAIQNTTGDGLALTSTRDVLLTRLFVGGTGNHGINANAVNTLSLTSAFVQNSGNGDNEYGLNLVNAAGTVTINGTTFDNAADNLVNLENNNTNVTFNVTGSSQFSYPTVVGATANSAILLLPGGTASITASIQNSTFTNIVSASAQIGANQLNSSGTQNFTFSSNTINVTLPARGSGVAVSGQELTTTNIAINNNTFSGAGGNGVISIDTNDSSRVEGTVSGNTITNSPGIGMFVAVDEAATNDIVVNGNTITNAGGDGIQAVNFGGVGVSTMQLAITNNQVNGHSGNTAVSFVGGISFTNFEDTACVVLRGNTVTGTPASPTQCGGAPCVDHYLEEVGGTMTLEEVPNTATTTANAAYVNSINDAGPVTIFGIIDLTNGAVCNVVP